MFWKQIAKTVSFYLYVLAGILFVPFIIAFTYEFLKEKSLHPQPYETLAFLKTILIVLFFASLLHFLSRNASRSLFRKEGIAAVMFIWILTPAFSALPFLFNGTLERFEDAYFEMTSGYTTTGITVLFPKKYNPETHAEEPYQMAFRSLGQIEVPYTFYGTVKPVNGYVGIEAVGKGLLFWRSLTQWLGGIGIVLLFLAILPTLEGGSKVLFQSEAVGPIKEAVTPRIQDAATLIFKIYISLTICQIILLMITNDRLLFFDALTLAFATISSGGFSIHNEGIAHYQSMATHWIIIIFMILGTINFALFYYILKGKLYRLRDPELATYLSVILVFSLLMVWKLSSNYDIAEAIHQGTFQIVSALSTTGFSTRDYDLWPYGAQALMLVAMFIGGMSGSTAGGIKIIRHYILAKLAIHKTESVFRQESVRALYCGSSRIGITTASTILCFFFIYAFIATFATLVYIFSGIDPETSLGLVAANLNNVGFAFRVAGPTESCAFLTPFGKYFSCFLMYLGRLELFIPLALLVPAFWKKN